MAYYTTSAWIIETDRTASTRERKTSYATSAWGAMASYTTSTWGTMANTATISSARTTT